MKTSLLVALLLVSLVVLSACAGGEAEPTATPTSAPTPAPSPTPTPTPLPLPPTPTATAAPTPSPTATAAPAEATVRAWLDAYAALDADRLVALHIPEQRQIQRPGYESWAAEVQAALAQTGPDTTSSRIFRALFTDPAP